MPPRKDLSGETDSSKRGLHEDLLQLLPSSTIDLVKVKQLMPKEPRVKIEDGLYDMGNYIRDAKIGTLNASGIFDLTGMTLFMLGFSQRNAPVPTSNIWQFDLGKLVVPSVFLDADVMIQIAKNYDPITREIRDARG